MRAVMLIFSLLFSIPYSSASASDILLTMKSYGSVHIGMTVDEAYVKLKAIKGKGISKPTNVGKHGCDYYHPYKGLSFMTNDRRIVRIETIEKNVITSSGIRVGDPISKVKSIFGGRLKDNQQHYSDDPKDRTLTIISRDGKTGMRFEASGRVAKIYAGYEHSIHYVEGCS